MNYDSFGDGAGSSLTRYGYTGRERDADTGLYYYRARWYDPQTGRFLGEDPIGFEGGINWYAYVESNPVNDIDPLGLQGGLSRVMPRPVPPVRPLSPQETIDGLRELHDLFIRATDWDWVRRVRQRLGTDPAPTRRPPTSSRQDPCRR